MPDVPVTCGKRGKDCQHKIKLGGMGICKDHCKFELGPAQTFVLLTPLDKKAPDFIRVNGKKLTSMDQVKLRPNDRIQVGPSALFLFKNKEHEDEASMPDTEADPITFDFADNEVIEAEEAECGKELEAQKESLKKEAEASEQQALTDLNKKMDDEE